MLTFTIFTQSRSHIPELKYLQRFNGVFVCACNATFPLIKRQEEALRGRGLAVRICLPSLEETRAEAASGAMNRNQPLVSSCPRLFTS